MTGADLVLMSRRRAGLTQRELAERIDCRQATIARWERGDRHPSYDEVQAVARACALQLDAHLTPEDCSWWPQIAIQLDHAPLQRVRRLTPSGAFDAVPVLDALAASQAPAIVIGEVAGALHGWPLVLGGATVEVCVRGEDALNELPSDGRLLVTVLPPGTTGFGDLARDAATVEIDGAEIRVAGLRDLLRIADASPDPSARRQALAYQAVLDVERARLKAGAADDLRDEEKIEAWLSRQTPVA
jgi:transcriptional regulator with XRE-family HTH domain